MVRGAEAQSFLRRRDDTTMLTTLEDTPAAVWGCRVPQWVRKRPAHGGIHVRRDTLLSIAYSEELISSTISATLQSTD